MTATQIQTQFAKIREEAYQNKWGKVSPIVLFTENGIKRMAYYPGPMILVVK